MERNLVTRAIRYRGTYDRADQYLRGNVCIHDGCLFVAARDNPVDAPGVCPDWQLVGKERVQQARLTGGAGHDVSARLAFRKASRRETVA